MLYQKLEAEVCEKDVFKLARDTEKKSRDLENIWSSKVPSSKVMTVKT